MIRIQTPRLVLREHRMDDAPALHAILSDPAATWYIPDMHRDQPGDTEGYLRSTLRDRQAHPRLRYNLAVADGQDVCIGEVGLRHIDGPADSGCWTLGYYLRPDLWNHGLATEATEAALGFIFAQGARRVSASCLAENLSSRTVLWKCGFTREGMLLAHTWHDRQWKDCAVYRLLREEWIAREDARREGNACRSFGET